MKNNIGYYVQEINDVIQNTEETGDSLNEFYEVIDKGIQENTLDKINSAELAKIYERFQEGTKNYQTNLSKVKLLKPPAKLIGNHKKLQKAYQDFVVGCQEMTQSINHAAGTVDGKAFREAETKQDQSTEIISNCIQKLTRSVLG